MIYLYRFKFIEVQETNVIFGMHSTILFLSTILAEFPIKRTYASHKIVENICVTCL